MRAQRLQNYILLAEFWMSVGKVVAQSSSWDWVWESRRFLAVLLTANVDTRHRVSHFIKYILSHLCILYYSYVRCTGEVLATRGQFSRDVFLDTWTRGVLKQPQRKIAWLMRYQEGFRFKVQCRDGRVSTCFLDVYIITQSALYIITQSGAACWYRYQTSQLAHSYFTSFWELRSI